MFQKKMSPAAVGVATLLNGVLPDRPDVAVWVEAAARRGRPVYFQVVGPWSRPNRLFSSRGADVGKVLFDYAYFAQS